MEKRVQHSAQGWQLALYITYIYIYIYILECRPAKAGPPMKTYYRRILQTHIIDAYYTHILQTHIIDAYYNEKASFQTFGDVPPTKINHFSTRNPIFDVPEAQTDEKSTFSLNRSDWTTKKTLLDQTENEINTQAPPSMGLAIRVPQLPTPQYIYIYVYIQIYIYIYVYIIFKPMSGESHSPPLPHGA